MFLSSFVFEMHVVLHPHPPIFEYFPLRIPKFQLLDIVRKLSVSITLSLEQLAPLYTPQPPLSSILSHVEIATLNALAESNHMLAGEIGPALSEAEGVVERRQQLERLKEDIVRVLVDERIGKAKSE